MAGATFSQFTGITPGIAIDALDWGCGYFKWFKDVTTGFWCYFSSAQANGSGTVQLWVKETVTGRVYLVASAASNTSNPHPDTIISTVQSSNGNVHAIAAYNDATNITYYYVRYTLTITSGRITAYTIDTTIALPLHLADTIVDVHAAIIMGTLAGVEVPIYCWSGPFVSGTLYRIYGGYINGISGTVASVGMDGTGTDTQVLSRTAVTVGNHGCQCLVIQEPTSETVYFFTGTFNTDYYLGVSASTDYDLVSYPFTRSGSYWTAGSANVIYTVPGGGADQPLLCAAYSVAGKACFCYYTQAVGLVIGYYDSSAIWTAVWQTLSSTIALAYFAVFSTNGTDVWAVYNAYNSLGSVATGEYMILSGGTWARSPDLTAAKSEGLWGSTGWSSGLMALRGTVGDTAAQTRTGSQVAAITAIPPTASPFTKGVNPLTKRSVRLSGIRMGTDIREWF